MRQIDHFTIHCVGDEMKSMRFEEHFDIYKSIKDDIETCGELIDIGCGKMFNLFDFENSCFDKLTGLDKSIYDLSACYRCYLKKIKFLSEKEISETNFDSKRYNILRPQDLIEFTYESYRYSFIICASVLHFFPHTTQFNLIDKFYTSLEEKGILFLRINHIYKEGAETALFSDTPQYLINPDNFLNEIRVRYNVIEKYTVTTINGALQLVIKKH